MAGGALPRREEEGGGGATSGGGGVRAVRVRRRQQRVGTEDGGSGSISLGCGKKKLLWTVAVKKVDVGCKLRKS